MDNITHTMVGAALGQAGLKKMTGLGMATLMIAANIPDVDGLTIAFNDSLTFRRGWTHGPVGIIVLPIILAGLMIGWDRLQTRWDKRPAGRAPVRPWQLLLLAYVGTLTHPFFDWLNTYGIRLLMPFSHEWFYGDALFIIDPWVWLALGAGLFASIRRERRGVSRPTKPAAIALAAVTLYVGLMIGGSRVASSIATQEIEARDPGTVERLMAGPVPANPFRREIVYDRGDSYGFGMLTFTPRPEVSIEADSLPKNDDHPLVLEAMREQPIQDFLYWSRFPFFRIEEAPDGFRVSVGDVRFARGRRGEWASRSVVVRER